MTAPQVDEVEVCCATAYGGAVARFLLGESFHPGGVALTRTLVRQLELSPGRVLVDAATGRGPRPSLRRRMRGAM